MATDTAEQKSNRGLKPGETNNPFGRRPGGQSLAELIRHRVDDGNKIVKALLNVADLESLINGAQPNENQRWAIGILLDRGWGKPLQQTQLDVHAEIHVSDPVLTQYSIDQLLAMAETANKLTNRAGSDPPAIEGAIVDARQP